MSALSDLRQAVRSFVVSKSARHLERTGAAKRAATFAILHVEASQTGLFESQISSLSTQFDRVLAVWPNEQSPSRLPKNVELFTLASGVKSRWQLLNRCADGFVFPVSLIKPIQPNHADHLKRHLFVVGGANAVGLYNFDSSSPLVRDEDESTLELVPMPILDLDYAVIDQRFWKLTGREFQSFDGLSELALEAHARGFGLFACNDSLAESNLPKRANHLFSRFDLVEMALRNPKLLHRLTLSDLNVWTKAWDSLGAKRETPSPSELLISTGLALEKNPTFSKTTKTAARKLLGALKKPQGVRS